MRTGASAVCTAGGVTVECNSAEVRFRDGHNEDAVFEKNIKFCIDNNIYVIANYCMYSKPFNSSRLNTMMTIMFTNGCTKSNSRITVHNEPMKYVSKELYAQQIDQVYTQVNGDFYIGAGNEEFLLAQAKGNMYQYILDNAQFDYLDIHLQSSMIGSDGRVNFERVRHWLSISRQWAVTYGKKLSCTEANWSKIKEATGHKDLMQERELARQHGCEDFDIVFIDGLWEKYKWLSYLYRGNQNSPYWNDLRQKMLDEKTIEPPEEDEDMKLELLKPGSDNNQVRWLQEILMLEYGYPNEFENPFDGKYGNYTRQQVEAYQEANGLTKDGYVGVNTTLDLLFDVDKKPVEDRVFTTDYWDKRLKILVSFDK